MSDVVNGFDMLKNTKETNSRDWLRNTKLIAYAVVTEVLGRNVAKVEQVVRDGLSREIYTVPILCPSSQVLEVDASAQKGDLVLVLFLNRFNRRMFENAKRRFEQTGQWALFDSTPHGYDRYSGIGILISPATGISDTVISAKRLGDKTVLSVVSYADWVLRLTGSFSFSLEPVEETPVPIRFGRFAQLEFDFDGPVNERHGYAVSEDSELDADIDAPFSQLFSEYAPVSRDYRADVSERYGLSTDPNGDPDGEETEVATEVKRVFGSLTVKKDDIRGTQEIRIGLEEDDSPTDDAAVDVSIGANAPVTVESAAGIAVTAKGMILSADDEPFEVSGSEVHLNGDTKTLPTFAELQTALNAYATAIQTTLASGSNGGGPVVFASPPPASIDISAAETTTVKTGG